MSRLMGDEPISFDAGDLGMAPMRVVIVGGVTEAVIMADLARHGLLPQQEAGA